jgi:hypothetical protein
MLVQVTMAVPDPDAVDLDEVKLSYLTARSASAR